MFQSELMEKYYQKESCFNKECFIDLDDMQFCMQTIINFPKYLFIRIFNDAPQFNDDVIIDEKLTFIKVDNDLIEYEIIAIIFFSFQHFYSIHRCWNNQDGPIWILYNDPEEPIAFHGFFSEAFLHFSLNASNAIAFVYRNM